MNEYQIRQELAARNYLREQLQEQFPDADEETLRDTLDGINDLPEMIEELLRSSLDDTSLATALKIRMDDMRERYGRLQDRVDRKRKIASSAMDQANIKKIEVPEFTASLRLTPAGLVITAEHEIPQAYWVEQPDKLDRAKLKSDLKDGKEIDGAGLGNQATTLAVRTK